MIVNKANFSEVDGARTRNHRIDSPQDQSSTDLSDKKLRQQTTVVAPTVAPVNAKSVENPSILIANSHDEPNSDSVEANFAAALVMIASLPLSDAEKAEAVRRLLTGSER